MSLKLINITKNFNKVVAVNKLNIEVNQGESFSFLGPSGCGKTTTLRMIAGFEDELVIKDVTFAKTEKLGLRPDDRGVVFDVYCVTNEDKHVIVEMQKKEQEYFADRALYYTARAIVQQGVRGIWDYHLAPVYTVCFMDFVSVIPSPTIATCLPSS